MRKTYLKRYALLFAFLTMSVMAFAQTGGITGKVVDETNQPLPGSSVSIDGTTIGASTDVNGNFTIGHLKAGTYSITAKYIGYTATKKSVTIEGSVVAVNFSLQPENKSLNEVVVIGYGTVKKKDLTGSIATVTAKDFNQGDVTTPEELIQGKVAGVSIITNSGAPGAGSQILIRGGASLQGNNQPLIVIDGVPLTDESTSGSPSSIAGVANPLDLINPNDIESFSILKDASAAAIYGNRASNGVIIITTKKGQSGKPQINFNTQLAIGKLTKEASVLSANQFRTFIDQFAAGDTTLTRQLGSANTDWQKEIYQTSVSNTDNLSISGTTGKLPYRVSVGYTDENGILKTSSLARYTTGINLSPSFFTDHLKVNFNFLGSKVNQRFANQGAIGSAVSMNPTNPVYSGNSNFGGFFETLEPNSSALNDDGVKNPLGLLEEEQNKSTVYRAITSLALDYKFHFFPDLHANVNLAYDGSKGSGFDDIPPTAASQQPGTKDANGVVQFGYNSKYKSTIGNSTVDAYLSYSHDFKSIKSHIDAVAGYSEQNNSETTYNYNHYFSNGEVIPGSTSNYPYDIQQNQLASVYGRVNYSYDDKFLLTGTMREDVSTKFAPGIRTGYFPSVAGAWIISNEGFLKGNTTLSNLKLRLEYGVTGNQDGIGNYDYLSPYSLGNKSAEYQFGYDAKGDAQFYQIYRPGAYFPGRTWEQTATTNAAFDFGFLNDRITGSFDVYYRTTKNLLATTNEPLGTNFSNQIVANVGNMEDKGAEFSINAKLIASKDVSWSAGLNATLNRNKITKLSEVPNPNYPGLPQGGIAGGTGNNIQLDQVGYAKNSFYVYQQVYGANGQPLNNVFVDRNGDGQINSSDLYVNHSPDAQEYFGINSDFRYKKWSIGFSARASLGNYAYNNVESNTGFATAFSGPGGITNGSTNVLQTGFTSPEYLSDYYIQNASFFRMDNTHIGYNFGKVFKSTGDLRITANVQNVFIITDYKGVDPEITNGIDNNLYPRPRTYVLGLNLSL